MTQCIIIETDDKPRKPKPDPMMDRQAYDCVFNYKPVYKRCLGEIDTTIFSFQ